MAEDQRQEQRPRYWRALALELAKGATVRAASLAVGVSERTATRRLADPAFQRAVREQRRDMLTAAAGAMLDATQQATETLRQLLTAKSENIRLRAAVAIIDGGFKGYGLLDIDSRLAALEELAKIDEGT